MEDQHRAAGSCWRCHSNIERIQQQAACAQRGIQEILLNQDGTGSTWPWLCQLERTGGIVKTVSL